MNETLRKEWTGFMREDKEYTIGEAIEKYKEIISYLKSKKIRTSPTEYGVDEIVREDEFHLLKEDKMRYFWLYKTEGYTNESCEKIINSIDTVYHYYDVSKNEAEKIVTYARNQKLTLSKAVEDCISALGLSDYLEFLEMVFPSIKELYDSIILRFGMNFLNNLEKIVELI